MNERILRDEEVVKIRVLYMSGWTAKEIAKKFYIDYRLVNKIINKKAYKDVM